MEATKKKRKLTRMRWPDYIIYTVLVLFAIITFYLLWYVIIGSFSNGQEYASGGVFVWAKGFTLANYEVIFQDTQFWTAFRNTVVRTAVGVVCELLFTALVAYGMTSKHLRCKKAYYWIFLFTMFFSGGIVPMYLVLRIIGLYDTFWVYILPSMFSVYNMIIISNFYKGIPYSLYEAAELDGAGELRIWALIYMPLSKPVLATVALWVAVDHWNSYMGTMLYTQAGEWTITLQYYLKHLINNASGASSGSEYSDLVTAKTISYAGIIVALIPIMCFYPFIQKHFTKGIMIGSLKG
ncbi:MAG: carbohydrate ABC transporter permease [Clostridia bacterium]|nr:carbohydrate ABC transporter permease [Clostridia bacterium]